MRSTKHLQHIQSRTAHSNCPECRADTSRRFTVSTPFKYGFVHEYLGWVRPRLQAIKEQNNGGDSIEAKWWLEEFRRALHNRINSHLGWNGRKYAPDYAKYHLSTYGNDYKFLHD